MAGQATPGSATDYMGPYIYDVGPTQENLVFEPSSPVHMRPHETGPSPLWSSTLKLLKQLAQ